MENRRQSGPTRPSTFQRMLAPPPQRPLVTHLHDQPGDLAGIRVGGGALLLLLHQQPAVACTNSRAASRAFG